MRNTNFLTCIMFVFMMAITSKMNAQEKPRVVSKPQDSDMMVRIAEIEILQEYLEEYKAILKEESSASVKIEPGVICIFPMFQKENPTQIRLIYSHPIFSIIKLLLLKW